jgi:thiol-disulfide isomerase/thioredoxin
VALDRVPALVEAARREIDAEAAQRIDAARGDPAGAREMQRSADWERWQTHEVLFDALLAMQRLDEARAQLEAMGVELERRAPAPDAPFAERSEHEGLRAQCWRRRADLARVSGRPLDALAYLQTALAHDPASEDLARRAAAEWSALGGSPEAWEAWLASDTARSTVEGEELAARLWETEPRALPGFSLADLAGRSWTLSDLEGRVTLVAVWASWCGPCLAELPEVQKLHDRVAGRQDLAVVTLNVDENLGLVAPVVARGGYTFPVLLAREYVEGLIGTLSLPRNWLVDRAAVLRKEQHGFSRSDATWGDKVLGLMEAFAAQPPPAALAAD